MTHFDPQSHNIRSNEDFVEVLHHGTAINRAALEPLFLLANATGGSVLTDATRIAGQIHDLDQRVVITYQVDRVSDDRLRRVEIRPVRAGLNVNAQKWGRHCLE